MIIVSDDRYNASTLRTATVVVVTSNLRLAAVPGNVAVPAELSGLPKESVANVTQVATLDRSVLEERVSQLPSWIVAQIDAGLRRALGR